MVIEIREAQAITKKGKLSRRVQKKISPLMLRLHYSPNNIIITVLKCFTSYPLGWLLLRKQKTSVGEVVQTLEPCALLVGMSSGQPLWKTVQRFLKKLKIEPPGDIAIPLWGIFPKELKAEFQRDICMSLFIAALFTTAKTWKEPKCLLTDEWISKMWYIHTYSGLFFSLKKDGNSAICYNVDES